MSVTAGSNVSPLFAQLNAGAAGSKGATTGGAAPGQADFLKLLMAQMKNQDPMSPMQGTEFTTQLAQFSSLQGIQQLNTNFANLLLLQGLTQGTNLIGKTVTYTQPNATQPRQGVVQSVSVAGGNVQLVIGG